jgi:hypothetical protein
MPLNAGQVIQLVCLVLGTISGLFQVQYGLSIYQDVVKPASRYSTALAAPNLAKVKQFIAGDGVSDSPIIALNISNTAPDLSQNGHGTTNESALGFPEVAFESPVIALVDRLNNTTTDEKTSCPFAQPESLVAEPNVISPFRLFVEILEEILTFLLYWFLNVELWIFALWDQQLCLFAPTWVWEGELKARMMRYLDLLLALAPVLSWSKYTAIVDELEKRLTTKHERTIQRVHDEHQLVTEAKDTELQSLRKQLQDKDALKAWQFFAINAEKETKMQEEMQDKTRAMIGHAIQVAETDGLLEEHLKTIEKHKENCSEMLKETSDKSKKIYDLEASNRRIQTQINTYDQHLAKDGWKMTPSGLRPLAPPPGPPSSRIPAPPFRNNGPPFNPGAAQFIPRPATFTPPPPHYQPGFRGPQVDPRFMGH